MNFSEHIYNNLIDIVGGPRTISSSSTYDLSEFANVNIIIECDRCGYLHKYHDDISQFKCNHCACLDGVFVKDRYQGRAGTKIKGYILPEDMFTL